MPTSMTPLEFVSRWRHVTLKERSASQSHFNDLCALIGQPTPTEADPAGDWFVFEAGASKATGGQGWADVWKKGYFAWEYKGPHADLDAAYKQLLQYRESLQNPPLLIVSDRDRIVIHTNFTNTVKRTYTIVLDDLLRPEMVDLLRRAFTDPESLRAPQTRDDVTQEAAAHFATLAERLRRHGEEPERIAHFLIRLFFCLFAEDAGILPEGVFSRLVTKPYRTAPAFTAQLRQLFAAMRDGGPFGVADIPRIDGGLFDDDSALQLDSDGVATLAAVGRLDWSSIEPSIVGTLFERSLDPDKRSQLGAHYTSRDDILLIVEPVLMAPLRQKWERVQAQAKGLASRRDLAQGDQMNRLQRRLERLFTRFMGELASIQVLDPACGSGNFLYVALRELLDLEKQAIALSHDLRAGKRFSGVMPWQMHGIEVNPYASELAQAAVSIGYIQWLRENGFGTPDEPILKPIQTILHMDAILAHDASGAPVEPAWPAADVIIGNPPFLGGNKVRQVLGSAYVDDLFSLYQGRVPASADLVCYWYERARALIEAGRLKRAGLLATQGIRGGANRKVLERINQTGGIFWAQSDRDWILDGANVHVSMVGFDDGSQHSRELDARIVPHINADLGAGANLPSAAKLAENSGICFRCDEKGGPFDIDGPTAEAMLAAPVNPNGRRNSDVVRPYYNSQDVLHQWRGMWVIDFGCETTAAEASLYEKPFEYVRQVVRPVRDRGSSQTEKQRWWLHRRPAPDQRRGVAGLARYVVTPTVAQHRVFVWIASSVLPDHQLLAFARDDDYFFGVLHSRVHECWALQMGTQLEDRPRYTPTTTFETFPFPWPPGQEPIDDPRVQAIAHAARCLVEQRDAWLNPPGASESELKKRTLTNLYNQRPTWLALAHRALDDAVLVSYVWQHDIAEEDILARLLDLNHSRSQYSPPEGPK